MSIPKMFGCRLSPRAARPYSARRPSTARICQVAWLPPCFAAPARSPTRPACHPSMTGISNSPSEQPHGSTKPSVVPAPLDGRFPRPAARIGCGGREPRRCASSLAGRPPGRAFHFTGIRVPRSAERPWSGARAHLNAPACGPKRPVGLRPTREDRLNGGRAAWSRSAPRAGRPAAPAPRTRRPCYCRASESRRRAVFGGRDEP